MDQDNTEKYKSKIEEIFANLDTERERSRVTTSYTASEDTTDEAPRQQSLKRTVRQESLNDDSDQAIQEFCKRKALEELEIVREVFLQFQDELKNLVVLDQLVPQIQEFAEYAISLVELVDEDLDNDEDLSPDVRYKLEAIKNIKAQFFASLYNKYKKK